MIQRVTTVTMFRVHTAAVSGPQESALELSLAADRLRSTRPGGLVWVELTSLPAPAARPAPPAGAEADLPASILDFDAALADLHARGGTFACLTDADASFGMLHAALAADLHIMTAAARLQVPGLGEAIEPSALTIGHISRRAGPGHASALLLSPDRATPVDAAEAHRLGLCDSIAADRDAGEAVAERMTAAAPLALRLSREMIALGSAGTGLGRRQAMRLERACFALAFSTRDPAEGIAAFFEGRTPSFSASNPPPAARPEPFASGSR